MAAPRQRWRDGEAEIERSEGRVDNIRDSGTEGFEAALPGKKPNDITGMRQRQFSSQGSKGITGRV